MFKNNVFNENVDLTEWIKAAGVRAIKTMAQTALGMITVGAAANEIDWMYVSSVTLVSGIASILTSVAGIPEVNENGN